MKITLLVLVLLVLSASLCYAADPRGIYHQDNTYEPPSRAALSDRIVRDNYQYDGNVNPPPKNQNIYRPSGRYKNDVNYNYDPSQDDSSNLPPVNRYSFAIPIGIVFLIVAILLFIILKR